jgi:formate dehydrogenase subunit gamma
VCCRRCSAFRTELHTFVGWVFAGLVALGVVLGWRAARTLMVDSVRFRRSDLRWFARWPAAVIRGSNVTFMP